MERERQVGKHIKFENLVVGPHIVEESLFVGDVVVMFEVVVNLDLRGVLVNLQVALVLGGLIE